MWDRHFSCEGGSIQGEAIDFSPPLLYACLGNGGGENTIVLPCTAQWNCHLLCSKFIEFYSK